MNASPDFAPGEFVPGEPEPEDVIPDLETGWQMLEEMHEASGWEFGITLTASTHVQWNAEVRVTPAPCADGTSDRSFVTLRAGPAEWALAHAIWDALTWLAENPPPDAVRLCPDCPDDPDPDQ